MARFTTVLKVRVEHDGDFDLSRLSLSEIEAAAGEGWLETIAIEYEGRTETVVDGSVPQEATAGSSMPDVADDGMPADNVGTVLSPNEADKILDVTGGLPEFEIDLSQATWVETGEDEDTRASLRAMARASGAIMVLEARAIEYRGKDGERVEDEEEALSFEFSDAARGEPLGTIWRAHGMEGPADKIVIGGRPYVVFIRPSCA